MVGIRLFAIVFVVSVVLVVSACGGDSSGNTVKLNTTNDSGVAGSAVLTDLGDGKTTIEMSINGQPAGESLPTHIHNGTCVRIGGIAYPLTDVVDRKSVTTLNVGLDALRTGKYLILVHPHGNIRTDVACGDIPAR